MLSLHIVYTVYIWHEYVIFYFVCSVVVRKLHYFATYAHRVRTHYYWLVKFLSNECQAMCNAISGLIDEKEGVKETR